MRKHASLAVLAAAGLFLGSCASLGGLFNKVEIGTPETHVLLYGSLVPDSGIQLFGYPGLSSLDVAQVDPKAKDFSFSAGIRGNSFYYPVPFGGSYRMYYFGYSSGRTIYQISAGVGGTKTPFDVTPTKPGLCYLGSWSYGTNTIDAKGQHVAVDEGFNRRAKPTELDILRDVLQQYRGTPWQPLIEARIKELQK